MKLPTPWIRQGALGGAALCALILIAVFYSVVAGAVERAASRRSEAAEHMSSAPHGNVAVTRPVAHSLALARAGD